MNNCYCSIKTDHGPEPYVVNVASEATQNTDFRVAIWTGCYAQMTLMCIPTCSDIGVEIHEDTDQIIRIEEGTALVKMGHDRTQPDWSKNLCTGDVIFVPAGTWHNIINTGNAPLKVSSVYAPPHHSTGTVQHTKADA